MHGWDAFKPWSITTLVWAVLGFPVVGAVIVGVPAALGLLVGTVIGDAVNVSRLRRLGSPR